MIEQPKPSVGPDDTTRDWQSLVHPVAVLPVGSLEQHGAHMPLSTDTILAEYFAGYLAAQIGAARLPALSIAQSYEHTGFRGSVSLRPETFMAVIRDIVDQLEQQNFTRLIVLNGHGGNFALPTLVRDINRSRRSIRVMLVHWYDYCTEPRHDVPGGDLHAAAAETSVMLAVRPELVRDVEQPNPIGLPEATVPDLNHLGLGVIRPAGPWGDVSVADAEWGKRAVESVKQNMVDAVTERLAWFDQHPDYAGRGPVVVRRMDESDVARAMQLVRKAGWDQTENDWRMFLTCARQGCLVAQHNGRVVGTATVMNYDDRLSWIGMVLVDPDMRRRGIGTRLMNECLELVSSCPVVRLDATPAGRELYHTMHFEADYTLGRYTVEEMPGAPIPPDKKVTAMTPEDLDDVAALDREAFGFERRGVLEFLLTSLPERALVCRDGDGTLSGFLMGRRGHAWEHVGPLTARNLETATALCATAFSHLQGKPVVLDCPHANTRFLNWIETLGFTQQRELIRMSRGHKPERENVDMQYAIASPAIG